ncbi:hypothetical protein EON65_46370 [archaeon]|nr:MAG: hypothetical protein EON65_46370 [archaeon]
MRSFWIVLLALAAFVRCNWFDYHPSTYLHEGTQKDILENLSLKLFDEETFFHNKATKVDIPFHIQAHGTTTLAFVHNDSVIICVDSKASMGNYVSSRTVKKIFPVSKTVVATMAGGAADCSHLIRAISLEAKMYEEMYSTPMRVTAVAKMLSTMLRKYRGNKLSVGTMLTGYDINGPKCKLNLSQ